MPAKIIYNMVEIYLSFLDMIHFTLFLLLTEKHKVFVPYGK